MLVHQRVWLSWISSRILQCLEYIHINIIQLSPTISNYYIMFCLFLLLKNWGIDVLFPLVGWWIEGLKVYRFTPLTGFYDDRWYTSSRPLYFYQKGHYIPINNVNIQLYPTIISCSISNIMNIPDILCFFWLCNCATKAFLLSGMIIWGSCSEEIRDANAILSAMDFVRCEWVS